VPNTRRGIAICLFAVLVVTGCKHAAANNSSPENLKEEARRGDEAYKQYRTADYQNAKSALKDYLRYLDQVSANPVAPAVVRVDSVITCVRLAKLEEKNHGPDQAAYMKEAETRCQTLMIKMGGCSQENLRKEVDRMDVLPPK
jgi:hypothetical protein